MTILRHVLAASFLAASMFALSLPADARGGGRDPTFIYKHARDEFVTRYPGDRWTPGGVRRDSGPDQGEFRVNCHWIARDSFFGLPWGFQQRCARYRVDGQPQ